MICALEILFSIGGAGFIPKYAKQHAINPMTAKIKIRLTGDFALGSTKLSSEDSISAICGASAAAFSLPANPRVGWIYIRAFFI